MFFRDLFTSIGKMGRFRLCWYLFYAMNCICRCYVFFSIPTTPATAKTRTSFVRILLSHVLLDCASQCKTRNNGMERLFLKIEDQQGRKRYYLHKFKPM